jgi:hypothetical protein
VSSSNVFASAKDKTEFDQFMAERATGPTQVQPQADFPRFGNRAALKGGLRVSGFERSNDSLTTISAV